MNLIQKLMDALTPEEEVEQVDPIETLTGRAAMENKEVEPPAVTEEPGKPRILGGICEFCGTEANTCMHYGN
jgi:hypothetical protein